MRYSYFLIPLILLHQKSLASQISTGLYVTLSLHTAITIFQAGRATFHAYSGKKGPLRYNYDPKPVAVDDFNNTPENAYAIMEGFFGCAAVMFATIVDIFEVKPPLNSIDILMRAPITATYHLSGPLVHKLSVKQEAVCFLSTCALHWALWKVIKRSAEWYAKKDGIALPQQPVRPVAQEAQLPVTSENLLTTALSAAAPEEHVHRWHKKLAPKNCDMRSR